MHTLEDLWCILMTVDATWEFMYCGEDKTILQNGFGQEVHAPSLYSAVEAALGVSGGIKE